MASSWPNTTRLRSASRLRSRSVVGLRHGLGRDAGHDGDGGLDLLDADGFLAPARAGSSICEAPVSSMTSMALSGSLRSWMYFADSSTAALMRRAGVADVVEILEVGLQPLEDFDRVGNGRLGDVDLLEAAHQGAVLLEVLAVLFVCGGADAAQRARLQGGLEQVGGVHRPARRGARADHGVDFVDEHDGAGIGLHLAHHGLQPLFEIAAIAGSREQGAHVELEDGGVAAAPRAPRRARSCAPDPRRWRSCRRRDRRRTADCSSGGGTAPGWCGRSPWRGRSADRCGLRAPCG